jgi:hypothetical protein
MIDGAGGRGSWPWLAATWEFQGAFGELSRGGSSRPPEANPMVQGDDPMKELILAATGRLTNQEECMLKLAGWMGIPAKTAWIGREPTPTWCRQDGAGPPKCSLMISAETLATVGNASRHRLETFIQENCAELMVFGWRDSTRQADVLSRLTEGAVTGVGPPTDGPNVFELPVSGRQFSRQLAGLSFSSERTVGVPAFDRATDAVSVQTLMLANRRPVFIRVPTRAGETFLVGDLPVADIDQPLSAEKGLDARYEQLIPLLMFLRHAFGPACWHGPASTARLIIDDPLLAEQYGFLDYRSLLVSMERRGYGTSIAFIPWNYRRTSRRIARELFWHRPDLAICVHGCDHSNREFDGEDQELLEWKAQLAVERMERHRKRTGLPFEPVMVFPQGRFSDDALLALRAADYLAAVNSTCVPAGETAGFPTVGECLRPAVTRFHGFPIFPRRYPRRLVDSAFDMFVGRPALLVEHHQYFDDGCRRMEEFVAGLRDLEPALTWPTLSSQLTRSCVKRVVSEKTTEIQFFTRRFRWENADVNRRTLRLLKQEPDEGRIRAVLVDGIRVPFAFRKDLVEIEIEADPGRSGLVEIVDGQRPARRAKRMGALYTLGTFGRRRLSEFRDNTLAKRPRLLGAAARLARGMGATGDRGGGR